jgi:hypothetical protein
MRNHVSLKRRRNDAGDFVCKDCGGALRAYSSIPPLRCDSCWALNRTNEINIKRPAHKAVALAIRSGLMKKPSEHSCVDCGEQAQVYDHREYAKPLDVVPVCKKCNIRRGHASDAPAFASDQ